MYRLWNENNVKSSKVVSLRQNKSHSPLNLEKLKIITYNTNGLRAAVGKGLPEWLAQEQPDVLCIQETKLQPDQFPSETFETLGYKSYLFSAQKKGYSGVAILTIDTSPKSARRKRPSLSYFSIPIPYSI